MTVMDTALPGAGDALAVMCQNQMAGPTIIAADAKRNYEVVFGGKGDPDGNDVQPIPEALLRTIQFQRAISRGVLVVIEGADHPVVQQALARQSDAFAKRMKAQQVADREVLDAPADNEITVLNCIGPGSREGAVCGEQVPQRHGDTGKPPLCDRHKGLANHCVKRGDGPWTLESGNYDYSNEGTLF
jgi:hypothetical protein